MYPEAASAFENYQRKYTSRKNFEWTIKDRDFLVNNGKVHFYQGDSLNLEKTVESLNLAVKLDTTYSESYSYPGLSLLPVKKIFRRHPGPEKENRTGFNQFQQLS